MLLHQLCAAHMSRGFLFCKGENVSGSNLLPSGAFACAIRCPRAPSCAKFHTRECRIILLTSSNEHGGCCPHSALECTDEGAMFALCVCRCMHIPTWVVMGRERKSCMFELVGKFSPFSTSSAKMKRSVRGKV